MLNTIKENLAKIWATINPNLKFNILHSQSEKESQTKLALATISVISAVLFVFIIWATLSDIEEVAPSPGVIMPVGQNYVIQHLEGGTVVDILVDNGEKVKAGQKLITLNPTLASADHTRLKNEVIALNLDIIRLSAFRDNVKIDKEFILQKFEEHKIDPKVVRNFEDYYTSTLSLLEQQNLARKTNLKFYRIN